MFLKNISMFFLSLKSRMFKCNDNLSAGDDETSESRMVYIKHKEISCMDSSIKPGETYRPITPNRVYQSDLNIALQSALAAGLCLGLPAGLLFWLIIVQRWIPSTPIHHLLNFVQDNAVPPVILEMLGTF